MRGVPVGRSAETEARLVPGAVCLLILAACAPQPNAPPKSETLVAREPAASARSAAPEPRPSGVNPSDLAGAWRIASVNGIAPVALREDGGGQRTPSLYFSTAGYGGTTGCNFIGGLGLLEGDRYYTAPGPQTAMGCGDLEVQEGAIAGVLEFAPRVRLGADGSAVLVNGSTTMVLRRDPTLPRRATGPAALRGLSGAAVRIQSIDNRGIGAPGEGWLRFSANGIVARAACATLSGVWQQEADRIVLAAPVTTTEQLCAPAEAAIDAALATLLTAGPRYLIGPNGEVLIAAGGHWLVGQIER